MVIFGLLGVLLWIFFTFFHYYKAGGACSVFKICMHGIERLLYIRM
jgi:hypothetical protein